MAKRKLKVDPELQAAKEKIISFNKTLSGIAYLDDSEAKRYTIDLINSNKEQLFEKYPILRKDEECIKPQPQRTYCPTAERGKTPECGPTPEGEGL